MTPKITAGKILSDFLVGKKLTHRNQHGRMVTLEIEKAAIDHHTRDLEESTKANDWWPKSESWSEFNVQFVDGSTKKVGFNEALDIVEEPAPPRRGGIVYG